MPDFAVSTVFKAQDQVSKAFGRMSRGADRFGGRARKNFKTASTNALSFKKIVGGILTAGVIARGFRMMQMGVRGVTEEFVDFDQAVTAAAAKFPEGVKRGTKAFEDLGKTARKIGGETQFTAAEAGRGLNFLAMAGFNAQQAMKLLPKTVDLATVAEMDLSRATDIASDALGAFGLMTTDTEQLTKNLTRVNDVFAKTITSANVDMETMFDTMKDAGPVMKSVGATLEDFATFTGLIGSAGIKGSKAGTTLKNAFLNLVAPTKEMQNKMESLKVKAVDPMTKALKDPVVILRDLAKATEGMGKAQRSAALKTIFGKRAIAGMAVLLDLGADKIENFRQKIKDSQGAAAEMAEEMRKSIGNRLKALRSAAIETGFKFIDAFRKKIPGAIDSTIRWIKKVDVKGILMDLQKTWRFLKFQFIPLLKDIKPIIAGIVAGFIAFKTAMLVVTAAEVIAGIWAMSAALKAAGVASGILAAAWAANPVGVIVLAVASLVTGIVLLIQHWDWVKEAAGKAIEFIWKWLSKLLEHPFFIAIGVMFLPFITIPGLIIKHWEPIKAFFKDIFETFIKWMDKAEDGWNSFMDALGIDVLKIKKDFDKLPEKPPPLPEPPPLMAPEIIIPKPLAEVGKTRFAGFEMPEGLELPQTRQPREEAETPVREAPNRTEVESMRRIGFEGRIQLAGAPAGTTFEAETKGAPPIKTDVLGPQ